MTDLIIFSVGNNRYAINIENIQRIIQLEKLTDIPNSNDLIDGMMSYEDSVIKILNFRKLIGMQSCDDEFKSLFVEIKEIQKNWIDALINSIVVGVEFTQSLDQQESKFGKWAANFGTYDENVSLIFKELVSQHKELYLQATEALNVYKNDQLKAQEIVSINVGNINNQMLSTLDKFILEVDTITSSLQKLVIYEKETNIFAIKVDSIEDIIYIEESDIMNSDDNNTNEFLELKGILDLDGVLINVVKTITIPN